jgi:hypothetical protein
MAAVHAGGELPSPGAVRGAETDSGRQPYTAGSVTDVFEHDSVEVWQ